MKELYKLEDFEELKKHKYLLQFIQKRQLTKIDHRHDFYEIVLVVEGTITHVVDDIPIKMVKNSFLILSPNNSHFVLSQSTDMQLLTLSIDPNKFKEIDMATNFTPIFATPFQYDENAKPWVEEFILCPSQFKTQTMNKFLISLFFSCWNTLKNQTYIPTALVSSLQEMNHADNLKKGAQRWCELAGYSRAHLGRLSKKYYNDTPEHIIAALKMRTAEKYLKSTTLPIEEIADLAGFESSSRFHVVFKQKHGITPAVYRKNNSLYYH